MTTKSDAIELHKLAEQNAKRRQEIVDRFNDRYRAHRKLGRCVNGGERDGGRIYHVVDVDDGRGALCGTRPGRASGWDLNSFHRSKATCGRCIRRIGQRGLKA